MSTNKQHTHSLLVLIKNQSGLNQNGVHEYLVYAKTFCPASVAIMKCCLHEKWCEDPEEQRALLQSRELALATAVHKSVRKRQVPDYKKEYNKAGVLLVCPRLWPVRLYAAHVYVRACTCVHV